MSWIVKRPHGQLWVGFRRGGKQHTIRLGKVPPSSAEAFRVFVDRLEATIDLGLDLDPELRAWLERMADGPRNALTTAGLAPQRGVRSVGSLLDRYLEALEDRQNAGLAKRSTLDNARVVVENLREHFGEEASIRDVDADDCEAFRNWLRRDGRVDSNEPLAETTVSRRCRRAREIFQLAVDRGELPSNPWRKMRRFRDTNPERDVYIPREVMESVIEATPDPELRLLMALARYGGIRVPSEIQRLGLSDFNQSASTVRILSPKTEHMDGHDERLFPLWAEIEPHAARIFHEAPVGQTVALPNLSSVSGAAITAKVRRAIVAAGVTPWPKTFVNLRASCERDLFQAYPIDDVCTWLGHSPAVALKHYRRNAKVVTVSLAADASGVRTAPKLPSRPQFAGSKAEGT